MKVIDYCVAVGLTEKDFTARVRALIAEGWQPLGGASHTSGHACDVWVQAMVRYSN